MKPLGKVHHRFTMEGCEIGIFTGIRDWRDETGETHHGKTDDGLMESPPLNTRQTRFVLFLMSLGHLIQHTLCNNVRIFKWPGNLGC